MERSPGVSVQVTTCNDTSSDKKHTFRPASWFRAASRTLSREIAHLPRDLEKQPQHSDPATSAAATPIATPPKLQRDVYLMALMHRTEHHINVTQRVLEGIHTDRQLLHFLKTQLYQYHGRFRSFFSMKRVQKIFFVKVVIPTTSTR
jgi:hypothetical protein